MKGCGCNSNRMVGLVRDGKLLRLSFSENLMEFCSKQVPDTNLEWFDP